MSREKLRALVSDLRWELVRRRSATLGAWRVHEILPLRAVKTMPAALPAPASDASLASLRDQTIGDCRLCPLGDTRTRLVFGVGNPQARVMFIGEGPGFMEDKKGEPFVGPAGLLLDKILQSVGLSRQASDADWKWVYIANVVKCHPMVDPSDPEKRGNDRPPEAAEMEKCLPFLREQIRLIRPWFIVALGSVAAKALLNTSRGITALRGQWFDYSQEGLETPIRLLPTYHPAALLRNPDLKKDVWEDMKALRSALLARFS